MKYYIEQWNVRDAWKQLSFDERVAYMNALGPAIQDMISRGVEVITWGENDTTTHFRSPYAFFALWKFPDAESVKSFEKLVEDAGWYQYFEQVNSCGQADTPENIIGRLIGI